LNIVIIQETNKIGSKTLHYIVQLLTTTKHLIGLYY